MKQTNNEREKLRENVRNINAKLSSFMILLSLMISLPLAIVVGLLVRNHSSLQRNLDLILVVPFAYGLFCGLGAVRRRVVWNVGRPLIPDATREDMTGLFTLTRNLKGETQRQAREKLLPLLRQLTENDASLFDDQAIFLLQYDLLSRDRELVFASLNALEKVGNTKSLPSVRALAQGKHLAANDPEIREAAAHCLAQIEERLQKGKEGGQLLRPSAPDLAPQTLLRSYESNPSEEPSVLLRSGKRPE